jgi:hypothetical protein
MCQINERTCIELIDVANPLQAGFGEVVKCYLEDISFRADAHVERRYQIVITRYAML